MHAFRNLWKRFHKLAKWERYINKEMTILDREHIDLPIIPVDPDQITEIDNGTYQIVTKNISYMDVFGQEQAYPIIPGEIAMIKLSDVVSLEVRIMEIQEYYCSRNQPEILRLSFTCKLLSTEERTVEEIPPLVISRIFALNDILAVVYNGNVEKIFATPELYQSVFIEKCKRINYLGTDYHMFDGDPDTGISSYSFIHVGYPTDGMGQKSIKIGVAVLYTSKEIYSAEDAKALQYMLNTLV